MEIPHLLSKFNKLVEIKIVLYEFHSQWLEEFK